MTALFAAKRHGPIGVDLGSRSVKLVQFSRDGSQLIAAARWDAPSTAAATPDERDTQWIDAISRARESRDFRGKDAVLCLGAGELYVQNLRVPKMSGEALDRVVRQEIAGRLPFDPAEAELRHLEAGDVRHGDSVKREVIVMACESQKVRRRLRLVEQAGLRPVAIDVEPLALVRCFRQQDRREEDKQRVTLFVHVGATNTSVVISRGSDIMFVKYLPVGGQQLDESVARMLNMKLPEAASLRRYNGEQRSDRRDEEIARSVSEAIRPALDRLANEISLCARYHSVTFRGQPIVRLVLTGGEATAALTEALNARLNLAGELGDPLRGYDSRQVTGAAPQWDIAAGLRLRESFQTAS